MTALPPMPRLTAGRLTLREWADADVPAVVEAATDPYIVASTTVPADADEGAAAEFVARQLTRVESGAGYSFAVAEGGAAVGQVGVWVKDLDAGRVDLGYWTWPSQRGRGVAVTALRTASEWALTGLGAARLQLFVEPWNAASVRTAERAGYVEEGLLRGWQEVAGERRDFLVFGRLPDRTAG